MGATSITGTGPGEAGKPSINKLATIAQGPAIYAAGWAESDEIGEGIFGGSVVLPVPLPGLGEDYCVFIITKSDGSAGIVTVTDMDDDDLDNDDEDDHFVGFSFETDDACDVMYLVVSKGHRNL